MDRRRPEVDGGAAQHRVCFLLRPERERQAVVVAGLGVVEGDGQVLKPRQDRICDV